MRKAANPATAKMIDRFGGVKRLQKLTGLTRQAIWLWTKNGIPEAWLMVLELMEEQGQIGDSEPDEVAAEIRNLNNTLAELIPVLRENTIAQRSLETAVEQFIKQMDDGVDLSS